jgi:hypothetical protein
LPKTNSAVLDEELHKKWYEKMIAIQLLMALLATTFIHCLLSNGFYLPD